MKPVNLLLSVVMLVFSQLLYAQPVADFVTPANPYCLSFSIYLTNTSTGAVSYAWNFGDSGSPNNTSTAQHPHHSYSDTGKYTITLIATDSAGLKDTVAKVINVQRQIVAYYVTLLDSFCYKTCDETVVMHVHSGVPPFSYLWNDGSTDSIRYNVCYGAQHTVQITDAAGCVHGFAPRTDEYIEINIDTIINASACDVCDGAIELNVVTPYTPPDFLWSTSDTSKNLYGLCPGIYTVEVDDTGFVCSRQFIVGDILCLNTITGRVYNDVNGNCQQDTGEAGVPNVLIDITPGGGVFTDVNGDYLFAVDTGIAYTIAAEPLRPMIPVCPIGPDYHTVTFSSVGQSFTGNFAHQYQAVPHDLYVTTGTGPARPGREVCMGFSVYNYGLLPSTGYVEITLDDLLTDPQSFSPAPDSVVVKKLYWNFSNLPFNAAKNIIFKARVRVDANVGDTLHTLVRAFPIAGDADTTDNYADCSVAVVASYDPNDKAVTPAGVGAEGNITQQDTLMHYTIRFQNTGTDTAFLVVIRDTLDANLDYQTFQQGTASHDYTVAFEEDNIVVFTFADILLPDSNVNEAESHGLVTYTIKHKGVLPIGATIENSAAIYFDFNAPVITNTVINKIAEPTAVHEQVYADASVSLYPNPAQGELHITIENTRHEQFTLDIFNALGMRVGQYQTKRTAILTNLHYLPGIYYIRIRVNENLIAVRKVSIY